MKILIPYFEVRGKGSYPDDHKLFSPLERLEFQGELYWLTDYTGIKNLESGTYTYEDYEAWLASQPAKTGVRAISRYAMRQRFTLEERTLLRAFVATADLNELVDKTIVDFYDGFKYFMDYVDLDDPELAPLLDLLVAVNVIAPGRQAELLVDAGESEVVTTDAEREKAKKPK